MMINKLIGFCKRSVPLILAGTLLYSCSDDDSGDGKVDFDRKAMLENWYDHILQPAFEDFKNHSRSLQMATSAFSQNPDSANIGVLKTRFKEAYHSLQRIKPFEIGPSENISLRASLNTYPTDTNQVLSNIALGGTNLGSAENIDAKGFPALDYLLYGLNVDVWRGSQAAEHLVYLNAVVDEIKDLSQQNLDGWNAYRNDFITASGTDIGSSLGQLVNAMNKDYELIKNAKIGFPAGKKTLGRTYPKASEAYFASNLSMALAATNCEAIRNFYKGIHFDGSQDGLSLDDYLVELGTTSLGEPLAELIFLRLGEAIEDINQIPTPFSSAVDLHQTEVDAAYTSIQQNVVLLKTELPSALGVLITYQDNDGD
jgi:predicted lipoprotein